MCDCATRSPVCCLDLLDACGSKEAAQEAAAAFQPGYRQALLECMKDARLIPFKRDANGNMISLWTTLPEEDGDN